MEYESLSHLNDDDMLNSKRMLELKDENSDLTSIHPDTLPGSWNSETSPYVFVQNDIDESFKYESVSESKDLLANTSETSESKENNDCEMSDQIASIEELSGGLVTSTYDTENSSKSGSNSRRGRPKGDLNKTPDELTQHITKLLVKEINKIEKAMKDEVSTDRKREDKPRTKLIRLVKKLPDFILKALVSIGDYKHKDSARLVDSYNRALLGLMNIIVHINLDSKTTRLLILHFNHYYDQTLISFSAVHYSKCKLEQVGKYLQLDGSYVTELLNQRDSTSVKKLKLQMKNNVVIEPLFEVVLALVGHRVDFKNSIDILKQLSGSAGPDLE